MPVLKHPLSQYLIAITAGASVVLAFSPFELSFFAYFSTFLAFLLWQKTTSAKQALASGWLFGLGFYGAGVYWVYVPIHVYGGAPLWQAFALCGLFVSAMALFFSVQALFTKKLSTQKPLVNAINFALLWALFEWVKSWIFTGFPWLYLSYSQTDGLLKGLIPIVGLYGVSFFVALLGAMTALVITKRNKKYLFTALGTCLFLFSMAFYCHKISFTKPTGKPLKISLIQANIPQDLKWQASFYPITLKKYHALTVKALVQKPDVIVWPEDAIPIPYPTSKSYVDQISLMAKANDIDLILGIPLKGEDNAYYNAILLRGTGNGEYRKRHLLPFGDYLPFEQYLRSMIQFFDLPMSNFKKGAPKQSLLSVKNNLIAPFICYEIAFSDLIFKSLPKANILLTISNDTWFGHSIGPAQHLQIARAQALLTSRPLIRTTNNGITAFISPTGEILSKAPQFKTALLTHTITGYQGATPITIMGNLSIILCMLVLLFFTTIYSNSYP